VGTSGSHTSTESATVLNDSRSSLHAYDSRPPYSPILRQRSTRSGSRPIAPPARATSGKGKQSALTFDVTKPPFLVILFDREDYLRATSESRGEDDIDGELDGFIDPRLLNQTPTFETTDPSTAPPADIPRSQHSSPRKDNVTSYHTLTPLSNRQPIVNTIRIHPNLNLRNLFGNLPFSSSVWANNYPPDIQDVQVDNLFLPTWAMMTVSTRPDPGSLKDAFHGLYQGTATIIEGGTPMEAVIEMHPNIAALFNEEEYNKSGLLSRWAAGMVHSAQRKGTPHHCTRSCVKLQTPAPERVTDSSSGDDFTAFASMYTVWYLARWMISPTPETYEAMPDWLRPT
jgi:hypothetical protein